jgi:hypothetical protein
VFPGRNRRGQVIVASRRIAVSPEAVFRFLDRLENHARLAPDSVEMLSLHTGADGSAHALVRLRGPLGIERTARTVLLRTPPGSTYVDGRAAIGPHTTARVTWTIEAVDSGSLVTLRADVLSAGPLDSLLLGLGARYWLAGHFRRALGRLSEELAPAGVDVIEQPGLALAERAA